MAIGEWPGCAKRHNLTLNSAVQHTALPQEPRRLGVRDFGCRTGYARKFIQKDSHNDTARNETGTKGGT
jgi:hypothetical protein